MSEHKAIRREILCLGIIGSFLVSMISPFLKLESQAAAQITEEQLYYQCPAYLNNETANRREQLAQNAIQNSMEDVSKVEEIIAAYVMGLSKGEDVIINEYALSKMGLSESQYDKFVDDAVDKLLNQFLVRNREQSTEAQSVATLYNKYLKKAYDIGKETEKNALISDLKEANSSLTNAQVESIVNSILDDSAFATIEKYAGEGIDAWFLVANFVEMQEINLETIDELISICVSSKSLRNTDLHNGLLRYRQKITSNIGKYVVDNYVKDKVLKKITGCIKKHGVMSFANATSATKLAVSLAVEVVAWIYEQNHPSAKQICEALILQNFVITLANGTWSKNADLRLADSTGSNKATLREQYKLIHDLYYTSLACALDSAKNCTQDNDYKVICTKYANAFRNTWTYSEYINLCKEEAQKDIDSGKLKITTTSVSGGKGNANEKYYDSIQARFSEIQNRYRVETTWTGSWGGAIQCFGFARMVFSYLFGCEMPARYDASRYQYTEDTNVVLKGQLTGTSSVSDMQALMQKGQLGDIIQASGSAYGQHTMVFMACTEKGVQVYDCNSHLHTGEGDCRIHQWVITWNQLTSWYNSGISLYHAKNYECIYGDGTGMFYDDTINFVVDENGVLTKYNGWQSFVEIPEEVNGITIVAIGDRAFENNKTMVSVSIPETVKSIGNSSFSYCTALAGIDIPDTVESVGDSAFYGCSCMEFASLPLNIKYTVVNENIFRQCSKLTDVEIPSNVTMIDNGAFCDCVCLINVALPDSIKNIGSGYYVTGAFQNCSSLRTIKLPSRLEFLGEDTFCDCVSLEGTIIIPKTVKGTGYYADVFHNCFNLKTIEFESGTTSIAGKILSGSNYVENIIIPESVTSIGDLAFNGCLSVTTIKLPDNLKHIGNGAFAGINRMEHINIPETVTSIGSSYYVKGAFQDCSSLKEIILPSNLTFLGEATFNNCSSLQGKIIIPKNVSGTGYYAGIFKGCENIDTIEFENGMEVIPEKMLAGCDCLNRVIIPSSVNTIGEKAFSGTHVVAIDIPDSVTIIGRDAFSSCHSLSSVVLPAKLENISNNLFYDCSELTTVQLPEGIKTIGNSAFQKCIKLENIEINSSTEKIGYNAFQDCMKMKKINLPDSVTQIGSYAFDGCTELAEITLGKGITKIPQNAFSNCSKLSTIVIPYNVTTIEKDAFVNDTSLISVTIPRKTTSIATGIFSYPERVTIYGVPGTYAETYAKNEGIAFVAKEIKATSVSLTKKEIELTEGQEYHIDMSVQPSTYTDAISYKSSNTSVATVDENGNVVAQGVGTATIKVTVGSISSTCKVIVRQPVTYINMSDYSIELDGGEEYALSASVYPDNAYNKQLKWSSSDESVASVDQNGKVTAKKQGECQIKAEAVDGGKAYDTCWVTVKTNLHMASSVEELESAHPYTVNSNDIWQYSIKDALALKITFDEQTQVEEDFDFIYLYDADNRQIGKYTGDQLKGQTLAIVGDTVKIKLESDGDDSLEYGFKVNSVVADNETSYYTIRFDKNARWAEGSMSDMSGCEYGKNYKLLNNKFINEDYTFESWNTKPDGSGIRYEDGANVSRLTSENGGVVTLYAQWKEIPIAEEVPTKTPQNSTNTKPNNTSQTNNTSTEGTKTETTQPVQQTKMSLNTKKLYIQKGKKSSAIKVQLLNDSISKVVSRNKGIATVSFKGTKITVKAKKVGKTTITVFSKAGHSKKVSIVVQKNKVTTTKIKVSKKSVTLAKKGKKQVITVEATPDKLSTNEKIKASSTNKKIVTVKVDKATGKITITAKKKGSCKVIVRVGKKKAEIKVKVKK